MNNLWIIYAGGISASVLGLIGIYLTRRENTPITCLLNEAELKSYWNQRLVSEGVSFCQIHRGEFRPAPNSSTTVCPVCLPPPHNPIKTEPHYTPAHPRQRLNFGRAYAPV